MGMTLEKAIKYALDGEAVLFLGSGFSTGGKNRKGEFLKVGSGLAHAICDDLEIEMSDNLTISATRYLDPKYNRSLEQFIEFLQDELICTESTEEQDTICALPWRRIYTTNYDDIIELSSRKQKITRETITITNKRYSPDKNLDQAIIHINGYVKKLNRDMFYEDFRITDEDYNKNGLMQSSWGSLFESDLSKARAVIFVGYSLDYDQELVRTFYKIGIKDKCVFVNIEDISSDHAYKMEQYGSLDLSGVGGLAKKICEVRNVYHPSRRDKELEGMERRDSSSYYSDHDFTSRDVFNLLVKGELNREYMNQKGYCVRKTDDVEEVAKQMCDKKIVIVQSKLGNGKTIFLECLANKLTEDHDVYFLKNLDNYQDDLELVLRGSQSCILMIDDYGHYISLLKVMREAWPDNLKMVLSCRTAINNNLYYELVDIYGYDHDDIYVHSIDEMNNSDVMDLVDVLNHNRMWGDLDNKNNSQKKKIIRKDYKGQFSQVFYLMLHSKAIERQIEDVMEVLENKVDLRRFVLAQSVNNLCALKFSYGDVCRFVGISNNLLQSYALDSRVRELVSVERQKFVLSSSIYSRYLIAKSSMREEILETLEKLYERCSLNDEWNRKYRQQRRLMVSRSNIILVFSAEGNNDKGAEEYIYRYYDKIKNMTTATDNPYFWLQFGITAINLGEYDLAEIYFQNAYANTEELDNFDSYQMDTHYARLLLSKGMRDNTNDAEEAMETFKKAHRLLWENSNYGTKLIYVLRQVAMYETYYKKYSGIFSDEQKNEFLKLAIDMRERYETYFKSQTMFRLPKDMVQSYNAYRRLFRGTTYILMLRETDMLYDGYSEQSQKSRGKV